MIFVLIYFRRKTKSNWMGLDEAWECDIFLLFIVIFLLTYALRV